MFAYNFARLNSILLKNECKKPGNCVKICFVLSVESIKRRALYYFQCIAKNFEI